MENNSLYAMSTLELDELINNTKTILKNNNVKYKLLLDEFTKIMDNYPNLQMIMEDDKKLKLNQTDCKMLQRLFNLYLEISQIEEQAIFFRGNKEAFLYFKNIGIL